MSKTCELPPLPQHEKTYAGIPEAVFVVSKTKSKCSALLSEVNLTKYSIRFGTIVMGKMSSISLIQICFGFRMMLIHLWH